MAKTTVAAVIIALAVFVFIGGGDGPKPPAAATVVPPELAAHADMLRDRTRLKLLKLTGDYGLMKGTFSVANSGDYDIRDVEIVCEQIAESGTVLARKRYTIYQTFAARSGKTVANFDLGFAAPQMRSLSCELDNLALGQHRPTRQ